MNMDVDIRFPAICFHSKYALVMYKWSDLTTTTMYALKNGMFDDLLIVDSSGKALCAKGARKLHGVGPFNGYNIFFNQRIKVALNFREQSLQMSLEDFRQRLIKSFDEWEGWTANSDFDELKEKISQASSIREVFDAVTE